MPTSVSAGLLLAKLPERSTPYFSVSQQQMEIGEKSRKRPLVLANANDDDAGHNVDIAGLDVKKQTFCEHYSPMMGFVRGRFGPSDISMSYCCYREAEVDTWTKSAKCKILEAFRSEIAQDSILNSVQLFEDANLVLSWLDSNCLDNIQELVPKVNVIFLLRPKDDFSVAWETWAREHHVFLVFHDIELDDEEKNGLDQGRMMRHSFAELCADCINTLNTFLKYEACCPICKEKRTIHAVFSCNGTSKSIGALLANIMFFGHCDADTALHHLLKKPRVWKPLPLVDHTYVLEALFHQDRCIRAAIGK